MTETLLSDYECGLIIGVLRYAASDTRAGVAAECSAKSAELAAIADRMLASPTGRPRQDCGRQVLDAEAVPTIGILWADLLAAVERATSTEWELIEWALLHSKLASLRITLGHLGLVDTRNEAVA